jgi:type I restriction enzyme M protein
LAGHIRGSDFSIKKSGKRNVEQLRRIAHPSSINNSVSLMRTFKVKFPQTEHQHLVVSHNSKGEIRSHLRGMWLIDTPEERVRQQYVCTLVNEYGYSLAQMAEEKSVAGKRGTAAAKADILIWRTAAAKANNEHAFIVVECKADNVTIDPEVYTQGSHYAQYEQARFFVAHNNRQTKVFKVDLAKRAPNFSEIQDLPPADSTDREVEQILSQLKTFKEHEFADLLHECHNVIRNREHLDPAAAFDEIAKILFVKVYAEREMRSKGQRRNLFTKEVLNQQLVPEPIAPLFEATKKKYATDQLFADDERINLRPATVEKIVELLQAYNLSDTSEDVKGVAFERFLGRTFRGEIGQFFTPRPVVEFMIRLLDPQEDDIACDPAAGSGGFLIRFFEIVREKIAARLDAEYRALAARLDKQRGLSPAKKAALLREKFEANLAELDPVRGPDPSGRKRAASAVWRLANDCVYGCDANDRMARTSKMNMIMHGDGHGGVHHHNGFLNVNGIFERRFTLILTNPPFGASVEPSDLILESDIAVSREAEARYIARFADAYRESRERLTAAKGLPIASLFTLTRDRDGKITGKIKTELLFIERCLDLLQPGGRLGIVLPEGVFNNPSLDWVRTFVEDRARLLAVISLPSETFTSSGASVKCSLLFLRKHTAAEQHTFDGIAARSRAEVAARLSPAHETAAAPLREKIAAAKAAADTAARKNAEKELAALEAAHAAKIAAESRALLKQRANYPIFFYEAAKVGITATGEPDDNELFPNERVPSGTTKTALELYREFQRDPQSFFADAPAA